MCTSASFLFFFFFFNDTATTEIYTLSLHDALPISRCTKLGPQTLTTSTSSRSSTSAQSRSEEHTSELQSHVNLVCRLLLEKKKNNEKRLSPTAVQIEDASQVPHPLFDVRGPGQRSS